MSDSMRNVDHTPYNQIAGRSVERLAAISDGIFAVAMTLLVLDLKDPARELIHRDRDLPILRLVRSLNKKRWGSLRPKLSRVRRFQESLSLSSKGMFRQRLTADESDSVDGSIARLTISRRLARIFWDGFCPEGTAGFSPGFQPVSTPENVQ